MSDTTSFKPAKADLEAAVHKTVPDLIKSDLRVLFCGINPGLYSGATGHHFARPGNRFWPALHRGGFTPRQVSPFQEKELLQVGLGIHNFLTRTTAVASALTDEELRAGARALERKVLRYTPSVLAVLGVGAYRVGFARPKAKLGLQEEMIGPTRLWILPNPSGLNAHYTVSRLGQMFVELREWIEEVERAPK